MGLYTMTFSLSFAVGPWLGTTVLDHWGAAPVWIGCFALASLSALLYGRLVVSTRDKQGWTPATQPLDSGEPEVREKPHGAAEL
jgi:MFS family permease